MSTIPPKFGNQLGFWYPLVYRLLSLILFVSPSTHLPDNSGLAVDVYVGLWWSLEIAFAASSTCVMQFRTVASAYVLVLGVRLLEVFSVLFSLLLKGYYVHEPSRISGNRTTLLVILNAIEILLVFGLLFYFSAELWPDIGAVTPPFVNMLDALFFSVTTGTTLGYGVPVPSGTLSKALAMTEVLFLVFVVIVLISHVRGQAQPAKDVERASPAQDTAG